MSQCVEKLQSHYNLGEKKKTPQCQPLLPPVEITAVQLNICNMPSIFILFWGKCAEEPRAFLFVCLFSTLYQSNENGYDDYMCKCTKSLTLQRYIIPKLQKKFKACI